MFMCSKEINCKLLFQFITEVLMMSHVELKSFPGFTTLFKQKLVTMFLPVFVLTFILRFSFPPK